MLSGIRVGNRNTSHGRLPTSTLVISPQRGYLRQQTFCCSTPTGLWALLRKRLAGCDEEERLAQLSMVYPKLFKIMKLLTSGVKAGGKSRCSVRR